MKTYTKKCDELDDNGGILKDIIAIKYYRPNGVLHRVDGPACMWNDHENWWHYNGEHIMDTYGDVTPEQVLEFRLRIL